MTRLLHENSDKPHRCPTCHAVMPYLYRPLRRWLYEHQSIDHWFPRRCRKCGDVIAVPAWLARIARITETY